MSRRDGHELQRLERKTSSAWVGAAVAVIFLVLLIVFIAQNDKKVPIHFLGASGTVSEALALIAAAVAGAVVVLILAATRIVATRVAGRRQDRQDRAAAKSRQQAPSDPPDAADAP